MAEHCILYITTMRPRDQPCQYGRQLARSRGLSDEPRTCWSFHARLTGRNVYRTYLSGWELEQLSLLHSTQFEINVNMVRHTILASRIYNTISLQPRARKHVKAIHGPGCRHYIRGLSRRESVQVLRLRVQHTRVAKRTCPCSAAGQSNPVSGSCALTSPLRCICRNAHASHLFCRDTDRRCKDSLGSV
jgi:hypothetical protein